MPAQGRISSARARRSGARSAGNVEYQSDMDFFDFDSLLLTPPDPAGYAAACPRCNLMNAEMNSDGAVNFFDIDPFVACLFGQCP